MQSIVGNTWKSNSLVLEKKVSVVDNERIGGLIEEILKRPIESPQERVIVLPNRGKAHLTNLKVIGPISVKFCELLRKSESAIKTYMVEHKAYLQQEGEWSAYLKTLQGFAKEKGGVLANYLERELDKERMIGLLKGEITEETKQTLCTLLKRAFSSSEPLEWSDLYLLEQIPRLGLMKEEYLNGELPIELDKIQGAIHRLAIKPNFFDRIGSFLKRSFGFETNRYRLDIPDSSFPSLFKDLAIYLIDSGAGGEKKTAVHRIVKAFLYDQDSLVLNRLNLTKIPCLIQRLSHLKSFSVRHNQLRSIPKEIGELFDLEMLDLSCNQLESIPEEIGDLSDLEMLDLCCNQLESIPNEIGKLSHLERLNLSCNRLESIPNEIGKLSHLERLNLSRNRLESIPKEIGKLSHLEQLNLSSNRLESIPKEIGELSYLQMLDLSNNELELIPNDIRWPSNLETLDLSENQLLFIPNEIGQLSNLKELSLFSNQLESIPKEIGHLSNLKELSLFSNQLESIPKEIGQLSRLERLNLHNNKLKLIPNEIGQLSHLEELDLHNNKLDSIPSSIGQLLSLQFLHIYANPNLTDLPMSLGNIAGLTDLSIQGTQIPQATVDAILQQCRVMRDQESLRILPRRLTKWQTIGNSPAPIDISTFKEREKQTLNEWLLRLEKTKDFSSKQQGQLALVVCDLLRDVISKSSFKELFFAQAEANNSNCEDRAAMSLNELFTSWKIVCLPHDATLKQKLQIMTQAAKTNTLRNRLNQLIAAEENKKSQIQLERLQSMGEKITPEIRSKIRKEAEEKESVEIYLNYEIALKERLNLLSVIETMSYREIGMRSWINEGLLVKYVNENFYEELYKLPLFEETFAKENSEKIAKIKETFMKKFEALGECPKGADTDESVLTFKVKQGELMENLEKEKRELAIIWYKQIMGSN